MWKGLSVPISVNGTISARFYVEGTYLCPLLCRDHLCPLAVKGTICAHFYVEGTICARYCVGTICARFYVKGTICVH